MSRAPSDTLDALHGALAKALTKSVEPEPVVLDGEVVGYKLNAAALNVARQFLKDNGIEGPEKPDVGTLAKKAAPLLADLPFPPTDHPAH